MTWETEKPLGIGTRLAFVARFLGRTLSYTYQVTDFIPKERLAMATARPIPHGDDLYLGGSARRAYAYDPPKPGNPIWLRKPYRSIHGGSHAARQPKGPDRAQVLARTRLMLAAWLASLVIDDLVVSMSAVELNLFRHDRAHRRTSRHPVDGAREIELGLNLPQLFMLLRRK